MELKGYIQIASRGDDGLVQQSTLCASIQYARGSTAYTIPRPMVILIDAVAALPAIGYRDRDPNSMFALDLSRWQLVDFARSRNITEEFATTDDPFKLLPLAERYLREARHLDSLGVQQWLARVMNEGSNAAHVAQPALGSGQ